jgi:hypothetical protein
LYKVIVIVFLTLPALSPGNSNKEVEYEFNQYDNYYAFQGQFTVKAAHDCLMNVIFKFEHICKYASGAKSLEIVGQDENWYDVTYTYQKFIFFKNQSTWRRTLKPDEDKVVFEMIANRNNSDIIPDVLSSSGYYQILNNKEGYIVKYFQECTLAPSILQKSYIRMAKKEAIKFLQEFKEYVKRTCNF